MLPRPSFSALTSILLWLVAVCAILVVKYFEYYPGPNRSPRPVVGPLRGTDAGQTSCPGLGPMDRLLLAYVSCHVSSGIHLHGLCGFQVLWLWPTSLDQDVGILASRLVAAQSLGCVQPGGRYR